MNYKNYNISKSNEISPQTSATNKRKNLNIFTWLQKENTDAKKLEVKENLMFQPEKFILVKNGNGILTRVLGELVNTAGSAIGI